MWRGKRVADSRQEVVGDMRESDPGPQRPEPGTRVGRLGVPGLRRFGREVILVGFAILVYFGVRNLTAGNADAAFVNADRLFAFERDVGLAWEETMQSAIISSDALVTAANWVYIWGHWPVILGVATALYVFRRDHYYLLRNAMFLSGLIGFAFFALFPVAPPRLMDLGLVDTVTERSQSYRALQPPGLTNQYAAFPSLHAGWNLLVGIVVVMAASSLVIRLAALALPVAMSLAVVVTANHFVIDVPAGVVVVLVGLAVAIVLRKRRDASTLLVDVVPGDRGGEAVPRDSAAIRGGPSRGKQPREAA